MLSSPSLVVAPCEVSNALSWSLAHSGYFLRNCFITMIRLFIVLGVDLSDPTYNTVDLMIWTGLELYT